jgi:cold shock CspA family protein
MRVSIGEIVNTPRGRAAERVTILPPDEQGKRDHGVIDQVNAKGNFGFLIADYGSTRLWWHRAVLAAGQAWPENLINCRVTFSMSTGKHGVKAVALRMEEDHAID